MNIKDLIERLSDYPIDMEVMILDSFNGGGHPREINLGPKTHIISKRDADECVDCKGIVGQQVIVIGYGCY